MPLPRSAALLALLNFAGALLAATPPVAFDSFEYTGRDVLFDQPLPEGNFRNPILAGFYPDPSVCRVGADYYLVNSTFGYFPGIPIFKSRDLVNWTQIGHVIDRPTQLKFDGLRITRGLFAPAISHHDGTFYVVCTMVDGGGNFLVTARDPAGPWSDPIWLGFDGIDPSLFFDDDGHAWLVNNGNPPDNQPLYSGHRAIWLQEFDPAARQLIGPRTIIVNGGSDLRAKPVWVEGPHLYRRDGWYYLSCAEGGTDLQHAQVVFRSRSVTGPYEPWSDNPTLTQRDLKPTAPFAVACTGHADLIDGPDGRWWSVFLGCRPMPNGQWTTGRETFLLPVQWTDDGWPRILPHGVRVPTLLPAPAVPNPEAPRTRPLTGNGSRRDDFDGSSLSFDWLMLRAPHASWHEIDHGQLLLAPRRETLSGRDNPSFLARRVQHARFEARTSVRVPSTVGTSAGSAVFQNEEHFYFFGLRRTAEGLIAFVERANGGPAETLARIAVDDRESLALRVRADEQHLSFAFNADDRSGEWQEVLSNADVTAITVQAAGLHFTGAVVGLHARQE